LKGQRLSAFDSTSRFASIDYRTKPAARFADVFKGRGALYESQDVVRVRVRRTTPEGIEEVVFEALYPCQTKKMCIFT
jgi:hypothetical protein